LLHVPRQVARLAERSGAVGTRVVLALLVHHAHVRRQGARLAERSGAVGARVVLALLVHRAHVRRQGARLAERIGAVGARGHAWSLRFSCTVRTCRLRLLGLMKVLSQREQACARLHALVSFTMVAGFAIFLTIRRAAAARIANFRTLQTPPPTRQEQPPRTSALMVDRFLLLLLMHAAMGALPADNPAARALAGAEVNGSDLPLPKIASRTCRNPDGAGADVPFRSTPTARKIATDTVARRAAPLLASAAASAPRKAMQEPHGASSNLVEPAVGTKCHFFDRPARASAAIAAAPSNTALGLLLWCLLGGLSLVCIHPRAARAASKAKLPWAAHVSFFRSGACLLVAFALLAPVECGTSCVSFDCDQVNPLDGKFQPATTDNFPVNFVSERSSSGVKYHVHKRVEAAISTSPAFALAGLALLGRVAEVYPAWACGAGALLALLPAASVASTRRAHCAPLVLLVASALLAPAHAFNCQPYKFGWTDGCNQVTGKFCNKGLTYNTCDECPKGQYQDQAGNPNPKIACKGCCSGCASTPTSCDIRRRRTTYDRRRRRTHYEQRRRTHYDRRRRRRTDYDRRRRRRTAYDRRRRRRTAYKHNADCPTGQYDADSAEKVTSCNACPSGQFAAGAKSHRSACKACPAGQVQPTTKQGSCIACATGKAQPATGQTACSACSAGKTQPATGKVSCAACEAGKAQPTAGAVACTPCAIGTSQPATGQASCTMCAAGQFQPATDTASCTACAAGKYQPDTGKTSCKACAAGTITPNGPANSTNTPDSPSQSVGRCGPVYGKCTGAYSGSSADEYCNESTNWCGTTSEHKNAQASTAYDFVAQASTVMDLSTNQPCKASSATHGTTCAQALNGDTRRDHPFQLHTESGDQWVRVLLKASTTNPTVTFYARDCCTSQNTGSTIRMFIGATDNLSEATGCGKITGIADSSTNVATCTGTGQYVWLRTEDDSKTLQVPEFTVMGVPATSGGDADGAVLVKSNTECKSNDEELGTSSTLHECESKCRTQSGCQYFIFGKGAKAGKCWWEKTTSESCPEGWLNNEYDFFKLKVPAPTPAPVRVSCTACEAGTYQPDTGKSSCTACAAGTVQPTAGETACVACVAGEIQPTEGKASCIACAVGTFADAASLTTCTHCPAGQFGTTAGALTAATGCVSCPAGQWKSTATEDACSGSPCATGRFGTAGLAAEQAKCYDCAPPQFQDQTGQTACKDCPSGTHTNSSSAVNCTGTPCAAGKYGSLGNTVAANDCKDCAAGKHTRTGGAGFCTLCGTMKYQNQAGQSDCKQSDCGRGEYTPAGSTLARQCKDCEVNKYRSANMTKCEPTECGQGFAQSRAFTKNQCVRSCSAERPNSINTGYLCACNTGYFSRTREKESKCELLPHGTVCGVLRGCMAEDFRLQPGFWRTSPNSSNIMACPAAELCLQAASGVNAFTCAPGHTGAMCTVCADGWARGTGLRCETCVGGDLTAFAVWLTLCLLMLPLAYFMLRSLKRKVSGRIKARSESGVAISRSRTMTVDELGHAVPAPRTLCDKFKAAMTSGQGHVRGIMKKAKSGILVGAEMSGLSEFIGDVEGGEPAGDSWWRKMTVRLKIMVTFLQVLSQIHTVYDIPYPESFVRFIQRMAFVNLDFIDVMRVGCVARVNYYGKLFAVTLIPLFITALLYIAARYNPAKKNTCTKLFLLLTFLIFPSVSTTVLRAFPCRDFDDGSSLLKADYSIDCNSSGRPGYIFYAVLMTLLYPIGITALYAYKLWEQRELVCPEEREWQTICCVKLFLPPVAASLVDHNALLDKREKILRDKSNKMVPDSDKKMKDKHTMLRSTQFLFKEYVPRYWWFEIFECVRRLMITGGTVFFLEGSATQVAAGILVALISIQVYATTQPYINKQDDVLAMAAQWGIFFTLFIGLLLKTKVPSDDGYNGVLGGMLIFVNGMVLVLAIGIFIFELYNADAGKKPEQGSSAGTTANPMVSAADLMSSGSKREHSKYTSTRITAELEKAQAAQATHTAELQATLLAERERSAQLMAELAQLRKPHAGGSSKTRSPALSTVDTFTAANPATQRNAGGSKEEPAPTSTHEQQRSIVRRAQTAQL
jgi:hypothetical protein